MFVFDKFNSFHENLEFTIVFDNNIIHCLDIAIDKNKTDLYYKPTHTGQYSDIKISWNTAVNVRILTSMSGFVV